MPEPGHPGRPTLRPQGARSPWIPFLAGVTWLGVCASLYRSLPPAAEAPWVQWAVLGLFAFSGGALLGTALKRGVERRGLGEIRMEAPPWPGPEGGEVPCVVRIPGLSSAPGDARMTLACIARQAPSEGPRQRHTLWRETQPAAALAHTGRSGRLGATFRIPGGLPAPQDPSPGPDGRDTAWELELVMRGPLGRLRRRFRLPAAGRDQRFQRT